MMPIKKLQPIPCSDEKTTIKILRDVFKDYQLPVSGNKTVLLDRLRAFAKDKASVADQPICTSCNQKAGWNNRGPLEVTLSKADRYYVS